MELKNEFETAEVNEPTVFEPLKVYFITFWKGFVVKGSEQEVIIGVSLWENGGDIPKQIKRLQ